MVEICNPVCYSKFFNVSRDQYFTLGVQELYVGVISNHPDFVTASFLPKIQREPSFLPQMDTIYEYGIFPPEMVPCCHFFMVVYDRTNPATYKEIFNKVIAIIVFLIFSSATTMTYLLKGPLVVLNRLIIWHLQRIPL